MSSNTYHISNLLEKMSNSDKDYRFMATNDLMQELKKDSIKLDDDSERKIVRMLLKLLEDKNGEVQNLAVRCLGPLVAKVREYQVEHIVETLCNNMTSPTEQLRDISSIGLKTVINELPPASSPLSVSISKKITGRLTHSVTKQEDVSVQLEALDILGDILLRFGGQLLQYHSQIQQALLPQLASPRLAVRKRSIVALGYLVQSSPNALFELIPFLIEQLKQTSDLSATCTYVQCIAVVSRQAGHRIGDAVPQLFSVVMSFCKHDDDRLREYCIQAFEAFVTRCPKHTSPFIPQIQELCLELLTYDPNYNYDDDDDEVDEDMDDDEDDEQDDFSDDDDMSWKVRRASAKCLEAIISSRPDLLHNFYTNVARTLIARFKEREENVKADIFAAYVALLRQTKTVCSGAINPDEKNGILKLLESQVADIVKALGKHMRDKSIKTRQGCNLLLSELVGVLPGALSSHLSALIPGIKFSLTDKSSTSNVKIDTLSFLHTLLHTHQPSTFHPHIALLVELVVSAIADPFYKITSEALLVTLQLVKVIRPLGVQSKLDPQPYASKLCQATLVRLKAADIDQEVKERAIAAMGQLFANMGDLLQSELRVCSPIFLERLKNEITRLTTVKAITLIASSPLQVSLSLLLEDSLPVLSSFLRKNMRALKLATLQCLNTFVQAYGGSFNDAMLQEVMKELAALISEVDSHISQLTLTLLHSICKLRAQAMLYVVESEILNQIMLLVQSPLLQGQALTALLELLQALAECGLPQLTFHKLSEMLMLPAYKQANTVHKQWFLSLARCMAAIVRVSPAELKPTVRKLLTDLKTTEYDAVRVVSLLTLGEIGNTADLSVESDIAATVLSHFSSSNEDVKSSASYALGNMAIGNLRHYVPFVLNEIHTQPKRQYLLLHSLKEIITHLSASPKEVAILQPYIASIWELLQQHCSCPEEGTRNVVAECLGKLALIDPNALLPKLKQQLRSDQALVRAVAVTAVKYTISDQPQPIDALLREDIGEFLNTLQDDDLGVRQVALVTFNSAAHNKPALIRDRLDSLLPHLYEETKFRKELVRQVEMGPFKYVVDDGLDLRKAAFECMYTLLDSCLDRLDVFEFLTHVENGLRDHYDIKMLTDLMVARLSTQAPAAVIQRIERLVEPLRATCAAKVKANSVKQEYEKQDELKRSALRAFSALLAIPDAERSHQVADFLKEIKSGELNEMFESVQRDAAASTSDPLIIPMDTN